jgi:inner membrane protein
MDPLTQGALGAALPQVITKKPFVIRAGLFGLLAGMAPDLDTFIRSSEDPLLYLEYHRQFTHSLFFIPFGGVLCGLILYGLIGRRWNLSIWQSLLFCTLGYATHGLLDACTNYGTQLFWPFSDARIAWNSVSIIDPLFTLPILVGVMLASIKQNPVFARLAIVWAMLYLSLGIYQREVAITMGKELADERGHRLLRIDAKPSFANLLVWKTVYETSQRFYVDAVRLGFSKRVFVGSSIEKINISREFSWLDPNSQQAKDIERFRWFSDGYIAQDIMHQNRIIDVRFSMVPNEIVALWSIELSQTAGANTHVQFLNHRGDVQKQARKLWEMLRGHL